MKIVCRNDMVCVEKLDPNRVIRSKVLLPDMVEGNHSFGIVISIGQGRRPNGGEIGMIPSDLQVGDTVIVFTPALNPVRIGEKTIYFLDDSSIFAKIEPDDGDSPIVKSAQVEARSFAEVE